MAVTFTQKAADRISRAVKWVEQQIRTQGPSEGTVTPRSVEPTYVLTTSGTATSGFYPGKVVLYSAADAAWQEYTTCKILPANGETLTNNTRYAARYTGRNSGGDGVFAVLQGSGGGLTVNGYSSTGSSVSGSGINEIYLYSETSPVGSGVYLSTSSTVANITVRNAGLSYGGIVANGTYLTFQWLGTGYKGIYTGLVINGIADVYVRPLGDGGTTLTNYSTGKNGSASGLTFAKGICTNITVTSTTSSWMGF